MNDITYACYCVNGVQQYRTSDCGFSWATSFLASSSRYTRANFEYGRKLQRNLDNPNSDKSKFSIFQSALEVTITNNVHILTLDNSSSIIQTDFACSCTLNYRGSAVVVLLRRTISQPPLRRTVRHTVV